MSRAGRYRSGCRPTPRVGVVDEVAEVLVLVAVLGDREPREAGLPLVEPVGVGLDPVHPRLEPVQPPLETADAAATCPLPDAGAVSEAARRPPSSGAAAARASSPVPFGSGVRLRQPAGPGEPEQEQVGTTRPTVPYQCRAGVQPRPVALVVVEPPLVLDVSHLVDADVVDAREPRVHPGHDALVARGPAAPGGPGGAGSTRGFRVGWTADRRPTQCGRQRTTRGPRPARRPQPARGRRRP